MIKVPGYLKLAGWLLVCIVIRLYAGDQARVETGYSTGLFPKISAVLRNLTGLLPFSLGDILYGLVIIWLIVRLFSKGRIWFQKRRGEAAPGSRSAWWYRLLVRVCAIYIIFNLFWGINYNRQGISRQLSFTVSDYTENELRTLNGLLLEAINREKGLIVQKEHPDFDKRALSGEVQRSYERAAREYPFLQISPFSFKSSLWGWLGNYTGFTGYYNPFTGEAQVNTTVPAFLQPFIGCHEVAHQLGYAKENEANFVGYLAARSSTNPAVRYSAYLDLFTYANRSLQAVDSATAGQYRRALSEPVKKDIDEWIRFNRNHQSVLEPLIRWAYGKYLENNQQPKGIYSYDEVTAYLIGYYRKYGHI